MQRSRRSNTPEQSTEDANLQVVYGSDGTRTRDLRRDRPGMALPELSGNLRGFPPRVAGIAGSRRGASDALPRGSARDEALSHRKTKVVWHALPMHRVRVWRRVDVRPEQHRHCHRHRHRHRHQDAGERADRVGRYRARPIAADQLRERRDERVLSNETFADYLMTLEPGG
jgi:hypothetical protein